MTQSFSRRWQLDDELRAGSYQQQGSSADNIAALHLLICAVCFAECSRAIRGHDASHNFARSVHPNGPLQTGRLEIWFLYIINALTADEYRSVLASDVAVSGRRCKNTIRRCSAAAVFSNSLITILTHALWPIRASGRYSVHLGTFIVVFVTLFFFIRISSPPGKTHKEAPLHAAPEFPQLKANLGFSTACFSPYQFYRFRIHAVRLR